MTVSIKKNNIRSLYIPLNKYRLSIRRVEFVDSSFVVGGVFGSDNVGTIRMPSWKLLDIFVDY